MIGTVEKDNQKYQDIQFLQAKLPDPIAEPPLWEAAARALNLPVSGLGTGEARMEGNFEGRPAIIHIPKAESGDLVFEISQGEYRKLVWGERYAIIQQSQNMTWTSQVVAPDPNATKDEDALLNAALLPAKARDLLAKLPPESRVRWDGELLQIAVPNRAVALDVRLDIRTRAAQQNPPLVAPWLDIHAAPFTAALAKILQWMSHWTQTQMWPAQPLEALVNRLWDEPVESRRWRALQLVLAQADQCPEVVLRCCREALLRGNNKEKRVCALPILDEPATLEALRKDPEIKEQIGLLSAWVQRPSWGTLSLSEKIQSAQRIITTDPSGRAALLRQLTTELDQPRTAPFIQQALTSDEPALIAEAVSAMARYDMQREARDWPRLLYRYSPEVDAAVARGFGLLSCGGYERRLHELLKHAAPEVQAAAAESLGKKGTLSDVPTLRALLHGLPPDSPQQATVQAAIDLILERAGGIGQYGDLALLDPSEEGALSLARHQQDKQETNGRKT